MAVWSIVISCWIVGSVPLALVVGKIFAASPLTPVDELSVDVDAFLERLFAS